MRQRFLRKAASSAKPSHVLRQDVPQRAFVRPLHGHKHCPLTLLRRTPLSYIATLATVPERTGGRSCFKRQSRRWSSRCQSFCPQRSQFAAIKSGGRRRRFPAVMWAQIYTHDDGGALFILCDTSKKLISYLLVDPRAHWEKGKPVSLTTKADDGSQSGPSTAVVIGPTKLVVGEQSTWDISTMDKATAFFAMGDGVYARVFPAANFRKVTAPVLQACGDHW